MKLFKKKIEKKQERKAIFFDIDGVLNTKASWKIPYQLSDSCVEILAELARETKAELILSSTWKLGWNKEYEKCSEQIKSLINKLQKYDIVILGVTPNLKGRSRSKEIERSLYFQPYDSYIILDDDVSLFEDKSCLYEVNCETGLTRKDVEKIKKRLET